MIIIQLMILLLLLLIITMMIMMLIMIVLMIFENYASHTVIIIVIRFGLSSPQPLSSPRIRYTITIIDIMVIRFYCEHTVVNHINTINIHIIIIIKQ